MIYPTQNELKQVISYDSKTGIFRRVKNGKVINLTASAQFGISLKIGEKPIEKFKANRLALIYRGLFNENKRVLMIDGDYLNNRIDNITQDVDALVSALRAEIEQLKASQL